VDCKSINQTDIDYLFQLPFILKNNQESGIYQLGNLKINIQA
jgi:hypothetical protein